MIEPNQIFYFTYAANNMPFYGGWTKVYAPNMRIACDIFEFYHPSQNPNVLNCADVYSEDEFKTTTMYEKNNNLGFSCHEVITVNASQETENVAAKYAGCPFLGNTAHDCANCPNGKTRHFDPTTKSCKRREDSQ